MPKMSKTEIITEFKIPFPFWTMTTEQIYFAFKDLPIKYLSMIVLKPTRLLVFLFPSNSKHIPLLLFLQHTWWQCVQSTWECTADDELNKDPVSCVLLGWMVDIWPQCLCVTSSVTRSRLNLTQVPSVVDRIALHGLSFLRRMLHEMWNCVQGYR